MNFNRLDEIAQYSSERYVRLLNQFRGILSRYILDDPSEINRLSLLKRDLRDVANAFLREEYEHIARDVSESAELAEENLRRDMAVLRVEILPFEQSTFATNLAEQSVEFLYSEITTQVRRDIAQAEKYYNDFALSVFMRQKTMTGNALEGAHIAVLRETRDRMQFFFKDRSARRVKSQTYVRSVTRHALLVHALNSYLAEAVERDIQRFRLIHEDGNANVHGKVMSFREIEEFRELYFHPNARLFVRPENV